MTISYSKLFVGISLPALCTGLAGLILCSSAHAQTIRPSTQKELRVFDPTANATGHIGIRAAAGTVSYTLTLPAAAPSVNQVLSANAVSEGTVSLTWATPFSGTGTTNYLSKFADAGTLTNSLLFDNGTNVGIGTTNPTGAKLVVNSDIAVGENGENSLSAVSGSKTWIGSNRLRYNSTTNNFSRTNATEQGAMIVLDNESDIKFYNQNSATQTGTYSLNPTMTLLGTGTSGGGGNVGIGPITPNARLEVRGAGATSATTALEVDNSSSNPLLTVRDDGNVGIGTTSPSSILHTIASGAKTANYIGNLLTNIATSSTNYITKTGLSIESTGTWNGSNAVNRGLHVNATGGIYNYAAIFESGNVGIGTTSPSRLLEISFNTDNSTLSDPRAIEGISIRNASTNTGTYSAIRFDGGSQSGIGSRRVNDDNQDLFIFSEGGSFEKVTFKANGRVGIGTTNPSASLEVRGAGTTSATTALVVGNLSGTSLLTVRDDGNVGIGTTSPTHKLDVAGTGRFSGVLSANPGITSGYGSIFTGHNSSFQITINADYSGGQSNTYTPQYAGASSAGMFVMKQRNGGEGTVDVYVKASGTDGSTTNISTFTQILALHTNGNVGIGSVTPAARLEVRGKGSTSATTALEVDNSGGTSLLTVRDDGYVGIGTTSPNSKLQIVGPLAGGRGASITQHYMSLGESGGDAATILGNNVRASETENSDIERFANSDDPGNFISLRYDKGVTFHTNITSPLNASISSDTHERMRIALNGNVGIGTTGPNNLLSVAGTLTKSLTDGTGWGLMVEDTKSQAAGVGGGIIFRGYKIAQSNSANFGAIAGIKENGTSGNELGALAFYVNVGGSGVLEERFRINNSGVKIGTNGTFFSSIIRATITISASSILANTTTEFEYTVSGAKEGATVSVSPRDSPTAGLVIAWARVTESNKIKVAYRNVTSSNVSYSANNFYITIINP
jgi:hypothetical protein